MLATVFAAAVHDVDHPGVTSQYIINTGQSVSQPRAAARPSVPCPWLQNGEF